LTPLNFFFWRIVKDVVYRERCKIWMSYVTESSELQSALPKKCLPVPVQKLNIVLMCVCVCVCRATNGAHIETYRAYKELCEVQSLKIYRFLQYTLWLKICIMFYFIVI